MIDFVIMSHSENPAKNVMGLTSIVAPSVKIVQAGGMDDGGFGTNFEEIQAAVKSVYSDDGVLILMDMESTVMTAEMIMETYESKKVETVDCPLVEGAVVAIVDSVGSMSFEAIRKALAGVGTSREF